jgi:hypothetical protein
MVALTVGGEVYWLQLRQRRVGTGENVEGVMREDQWAVCLRVLE